MTEKQDVILAWKGAYLLANNKQPPTVKEWGYGWFVIGDSSKKYRLLDIQEMTERLLRRVENVSSK